MWEITIYAAVIVIRAQLDCVLVVSRKVPCHLVNLSVREPKQTLLDAPDQFIPFCRHGVCVCG